MNDVKQTYLYSFRTEEEENPSVTDVIGTSTRERAHLGVCLCASVRMCMFEHGFQGIHRLWKMNHAFVCELNLCLQTCVSYSLCVCECVQHVRLHTCEVIPRSLVQAVWWMKRRGACKAREIWEKHCSTGLKMVLCYARGWGNITKKNVRLQLKWMFIISSI